MIDALTVIQKLGTVSNLNCYSVPSSNSLNEPTLSVSINSLPKRMENDYNTNINNKLIRKNKLLENNNSITNSLLPLKYFPRYL